MDAIFRPSKSARLEDTSGLKMKRNGSPPIALGLALGTGGSSEKQQKAAPKSHGFTVLQMQELQLQTIIYKYIEAGCPVPYHLLLPIWRCVSNSFPSLNSAIPFPNFMKGSKEMQMETEPGRCKRTDGKKWRCTKEALPDQKYCERHMHRGRQRTRKLMEVAAQMNTSTSTSTIASTNLSICLPNPETTNDQFMVSRS